MKRNRKNIVGILCCLLVLALGVTVQAGEVKKHGKGLIFDDDEFLESLPEIVDVRLNKQAVEQIQKNSSLARSNLNSLQGVEMGDETITDLDAIPYSEEDISQIEEENKIISQIKSYDGSLKNQFPPIGNQGNSGSCVSWAYGYYQLTNNIANVRGLDAKNNSCYRISPAWIHNLTKMNDHEDAGTDRRMFFSIVLKQGAPYWSDFPGTTTETNFKSWNPDTNVWEKALENRIEAFERCSLYDEETKKLDLIKVKKMLYNGYVVSFGSEFNPYLIFSDRIKSPNIYKGEYILTANKETSISGGHALTIVGWNDTLEIDIDGDGTADSTGAFKVANSWGINGTGTKDGYFWIAYDSILPESSIPAMNNIPNRIPSIRDQIVYYLEPKLSYKPLVLLELTLKTESRRELGIRIGASSMSETEPQEYKFIFDKPDFRAGADRIYDGWSIFRFKNYSYTDTHYDFYGNETNKAEGKFIFDLTDTVIDYYGISDDFQDNRRTSFYVQIEDNLKDGYGTVLNGVRIIDRINNKQTSLSNLGIRVDGEKKNVKLNAEVVPGIVDVNKEFTLNFNYPIQKASVNSNIKVRKNQQLFYGVSFKQDTVRKKITVSPPAKGYPRGHYYSIDLSGVKSDGGNALTGKTSVDFYVP